MIESYTHDKSMINYRENYSTVLFSLSLLSLMTPIRLDTGFAIIRPFDLLILTWLLISFTRGCSAMVSRGITILLPFLTLHTALSLNGGIENFLKEILQISVILIYSILVYNKREAINFSLFGKIFLAGAASIIAYTIAYHLFNSQYSGWKSLNETKFAFIFIQPALAVAILFFKWNKLFILFWVALCPLIILSGERKALLIYIILTSAMLSRGRFLFIFIAASAFFIVLEVLYTTIEDQYVRQQLRTVLNPFSGGDFRYMLYNFSYAEGSTPSNTLRAFSLWITGQLFFENPLFGTGTNQYVLFVRELYFGLPEDMLNGIHGEFQRVVTENGLIGLIFYISIWLFSWGRTHAFMRSLALTNKVSYSQFRCFGLIFFTTGILFVGTEASSTRSFVILTLIALLPDIAKSYFRRR